MASKRAKKIAFENSIQVDDIRYFNLTKVEDEELFNSIVLELFLTDNEFSLRFYELKKEILNTPNLQYNTIQFFKIVLKYDNFFLRYYYKSYDLATYIFYSHFYTDKIKQSKYNYFMNNLLEEMEKNKYEDYVVNQGEYEDQQYFMDESNSASEKLEVFKKRQPRVNNFSKIYTKSITNEDDLCIWMNIKREFFLHQKINFIPKNEYYYSKNSIKVELFLNKSTIQNQTKMIENYLNNEFLISKPKCEVSNVIQDLMIDVNRYKLVVKLYLYNLYKKNENIFSYQDIKEKTNNYLSKHLNFICPLLLEHQQELNNYIGKLLNIIDKKNKSNKNNLSNKTMKTIAERIHQLLNKIYSENVT